MKTKFPLPLLCNHCKSPLTLTNFSRDIHEVLGLRGQTLDCDNCLRQEMDAALGGITVRDIARQIIQDRVINKLQKG